MDNERKKEFQQGLFDLRMKQQLYIMEHKEESPEIDAQLKAFKREYAIELLKEKGLEIEGESKHVKH